MNSIASQRRIAVLERHLRTAPVPLQFLGTNASCPVTNKHCVKKSCRCSVGGAHSSLCPFTGRSKEHPSPRINVHASPNATPLRICITGAAGQIGYSLIFQIATGRMFGPNQPIFFQLLDIPPAKDALNGVVMEIEDCAFPLVKGILASTEAKECFMNAEVILMLGSFPRKEGMERKDLMAKNVAIFKEQGKLIDQFAARDVKVLVVGNPANTNCLIAMMNAPSIPKENFSALTRLDQNRATFQLAQKLRVQVETVKNVIIWGNHSVTQYPDVNHAFISNRPPGFVSNAGTELQQDNQWLRETFLPTVQKRGAAILKARKLSSAASAANAIVDHIRDWLLGTTIGEFVSMGVASTGAYGIPEGVIYSMPVFCRQGKYHIVEGLVIDEFSRQKMQETYNELKEERELALSLLV